jgi:hypothetical protein
MRVLIVGAGASIEEAKRAGAPEEFWPPTVANFAKKMWDGPLNQFSNYWLPDYLQQQGVDPWPDPTRVFIQLSANPQAQINVERLFEYCWENKGRKFEGDWENLIYHGVLYPLVTLLSMAFYENGVGIKQLEAGKMVVDRLQDGDLVLSLNYETLFEIAATQRGRQLTYVPNQFSGNGILVAKPHGSLNLLADDQKFWFAHPDCIGALPSSADNYRNYRAIVPPRFNKTYAQHDIAKIIFNAIANLHPDVLTFWGVGLSDSDVDLVDVYKKWIASGSVVEVINPDDTVSEKATKILDRDICFYPSIEKWIQA